MRKTSFLMISMSFIIIALLSLTGCGPSNQNPTPTPVNLIGDPGFETGIGWTLTDGAVRMNDPGTPRNGSYCMFLPGRDSGTASAAYHISSGFSPGDTLHFNVYAKAENNTDGPNLYTRIAFNDTAEITSYGDEIYSTSYIKYDDPDSTYIIPVGTTSIEVSVQNLTAAGYDLYVDDVSVYVD